MPDFIVIPIDYRLWFSHAVRFLYPRSLSYAKGVNESSHRKLSSVNVPKGGISQLTTSLSQYIYTWTKPQNINLTSMPNLFFLLWSRHESFSSLNFIVHRNFQSMAHLWISWHISRSSKEEQLWTTSSCLTIKHLPSSRCITGVPDKWS